MWLLGSTVAALAVSNLTGQEDSETEGAALVARPKGFRIHPQVDDENEVHTSGDAELIGLDNELANGDRRWLLQHMREVVPTQNLSRGCGPIVVFERNPMDVDAFNAMEIVDMNGRLTTITEWLECVHCDAILVLKEGKIIVEQYFHGMKPDRAHVLYSLGKSLTSTMLATLTDKQLDENTAIESYVPELRETAFHGASIRHLLDMKSAAKYSYFSDDPSIETDIICHIDLTRATARGAKPRNAWSFLSKLEAEDRKHGELMRHKEADAAALVLAAERVTGRRSAVLFSERIWSKLGMEHDAYVRCDGAGEAAPSFGISATLHDVGRWGQMCLQQGRWRDQQVVPDSLFEDLRRTARNGKPLPPESGNHVPGMRYRSLFWIPKNTGNEVFCAHGGLGQLCYINPIAGTVIVMFGSLPETSPAMATEQRHGCDQISAILLRR